MRRPPRVVLWGGRPDVDIQFGSRADRRRARLLRIDAAFARAGRILSDFIAEAGHAVQRAVTVLERSGLARALRAQAEDERRMAAREHAGILQQRPLRVTAFKMTSEHAARAFLQRTGPPVADPPPHAVDAGPLVTRDAIWFGREVPAGTPAPASRFFEVDDGVRTDIETEWPETEGAAFAHWLTGAPEHTDSEFNRTHTFTVDVEVDPDTYGKLLYGMTWPFAVNMGWVAPPGPGGCRHPASAHAILAGCPGWRWCADCGTTLNPTQAGACA